ncbi:MAG: hypothetical protein EBR76_05615, partial [Actinobacteria bacterium]|nr:hypothetical protein [Actinomycetota bacterium]
MLPTSILSIFDRVTGSYIFTLKAFLVFSIFGPIGVAVSVPSDDITLAQRGIWLLIGIASQLALGAFMLLVSLTI